MSPADGVLYPEEREVYDWITKESTYRFADLEEEAGYCWHNWAQWAVPLAYLYDDYRAWKLAHLYDAYDEEAPHLLHARQFSIVLRRVIMPDVNDETEGVQRKYPATRICNRTSERKKMKMLRGVKHPDGYHVRNFPGRPTFGSIAPIQ